MKRYYVWGVLCMVATIFVEGGLIMAGWNLIAAKLFDVTFISYWTAIIVASVLVLLRRRCGHGHRRIASWH